MITPQSPFTAKLSNNFWLGEFALNRPERRFIAQHQIDTALKLVDWLEHLRSEFGGPVIITSGYRPWNINASVGGARYSEHLYDQPGKGAVDFYMPSTDLVAVEGYCAARWSGSVGLAAARRGFIHLGMRPGSSWARWPY
jgi:uncharacterized protein YcbK (DUF882 family)